MARKNLMAGFKIPSKYSFEKGQSTDTYASFCAYPFERGFGTTIGNTLRRVLLSSIQGYAITAVWFSCYNASGEVHQISSEFEPLPGVTEDICEIIANLKKIRMTMPEEVETTTIEISCKGPGKITGADFEKDRITVINKDQLVFTMNEDTNIDMVVQIDFGRGYSPMERSTAEHINEFGTIPVDAIFSPVTRVKYSIEPARVGQRADYDKLNLEVWTDGTIKPEDALAEAAKIAKDHFAIFINFDESLVNFADQETDMNKLLNEKLDQSVENLELSVRSSNCLKTAGISTIRQLTLKTEDELSKTRNFGKKSLQEIKDKLNEWNLRLGMGEDSYKTLNPDSIPAPQGK